MASSHRRQTSDPFSDHVPPNISTLDRQGPRSTPLPPPKEDMLTAVRDSVTVRPVTDTAKSKTGRSHSSNSPGTVTPPRARRSVSTDSAPPPVDKSGKPSRPKASKKASMHADIIDRLDFSGVGAAMLHHDGPFDACAPSRNKHKHKAPIMAWGPGNNVNDQLANVPDIAVDRRAPPINLPAVTPYDSPYGPATLYSGSPTAPGSIPKKRVDALAEAWGIAEPEPYEEFFAGGGDRSAASSIKNGKEGHNPSSTRRAKDAREAYRDYLDDNTSRPSRTPRTRSTLPPPQPLSLPGSRPSDAASTPNLATSPDSSEPQPPSNGGDSSPRRSRSLIARIRKMRDAPNVPVTYHEEIEPSESPVESPPESLESSTTPSAPGPPPTRPTHKHQTSFLGRFTRSPGGAGGTAVSPTSDSSERSADLVSIDESSVTREKDLPVLPSGDYFGETLPPTRGLGRKTSLMKRIKGVRTRGIKS